MLTNQWGNWTVSALCLTWSLLCAGCSSEPPPTPTPVPNPTTEKKEPESKVPAGRKIKLADLQLPDLGDAVGPLDGGLITVRGPKGWFRASRSSDYLIKFQNNDNSPLPAVIVTASEETNAEDLTPNNLQAFCEILQAKLDCEGSPTPLVENVGQITGDNFTAAYYTKLGRIKGLVFNRMMIVMVKNGREYTIEYRNVDATAREFEPYAFAVAKGIEFHTP